MQKKGFIKLFIFPPSHLVETASCRILLTRPELLQLSIQNVYQLLHQTHRGADITGVDGAFGVLC